LILSTTALLLNRVTSATKTTHSRSESRPLYNSTFEADYPGKPLSPILPANHVLQVVGDQPGGRLEEAIGTPHRTARQCTKRLIAGGPNRVLKFLKASQRFGRCAWDWNVRIYTVRIRDCRSGQAWQDA